MKKLGKSDIVTKFSSKITTEDYSPKTKIDGVELYEIKNFVTLDGDFSEIVRLSNGKIEQIPDFEAKQVSRSTLVPGAVKAWHLHFKQEDVWYVPPADRIWVGLVDVRKKSKTKGAKMRFVMGNGKSQLLYIPRGLAHGSANLGEKNATLIYFTNQQFDFKNPDEHRLPWDIFGKEMWEIPRG